MTIVRGDFTVGVYFENKQYTPQQVAEFIAKTNGEHFANPQEIKTLIEESQAKFLALVKTYKLTMDKPLQSKTSSAGKELAELVLSHCDKTIDLIVQGGNMQGVLI